MICPVTHRQVDEKGARVVALLVVLLVGAALLLPRAAGAVLLAAVLADFAIRGFFEPRLSPLAGVARLVLRAVGARPAPTNAGPKRFAARLGTAATAAILGTVVSGAPVVAYVLGGVLGALAGLEAAFGFCVACRIYAAVMSGPLSRATREAGQGA